MGIKEKFKPDDCQEEEIPTLPSLSPLSRRFFIPAPKENPMVTNMWRWFFKRNPQATRRLRRSYFPQFERLETREVPATMIWTGPSGGSDPWNTAADWTDAASASTHHVPTAADDVIIPYDGSSLKNYTVTISAGDPGAVAHSLSIGATNTLDFSGSSLTLRWRYPAPPPRALTAPARSWTRIRSPRSTGAPCSWPRP